MSRNTLPRAAFGAAAVLGALVSHAQGQLYGNGCNTCAPVQPVLQSCYQTVPVTEYQPVRQTVRRPMYRTEYVEQPVTVYRPVTEMRSRQVPTVRYQTVTSYRTIQRDMGRWVTQYRPNPRCAPCQVDNRPGVIGWVNRTAYQMRTAFRPQYTPIRRYQPRMVACSVPQRRQVAVRGTRTVSYPVTRMVATQTVQRRPVQRLSYVEQQVTVMRPRTTYRTVPTGTSVAYTPYAGGSSIAYAPFSSGSSVAYDSFGSSTIAYGSGSNIIREEVVADRAIGSGSTRSANLVPEPDDLREAPSRTAVNDDVLGKEPYSRPTPRSARGNVGTATGGTPFRRESRADTPARKSAYPSSGGLQPAPSGAAYERQNAIRNAAPSPPASSSSSGGFGDDFNTEPMFGVDPSARVIPPSSSRYMRTSTSKTPTNGWRASLRVPRSAVTKVPSRISITKR